MSDAAMAVASEPTTLTEVEELQTREEALSHCKSRKQRQFVEAYVGGARGNATEAARMAGYASSYTTIGYKNLQKPHIKRAIRALTRAETLSRSEVRHRLSRQATTTIEDVADWVEVTHHVSYRPGEEWKVTEELTASVGGCEVTQLTAPEAEERKLLHRLAHSTEDGEEDGVTLETVRAQTERGRLCFAAVTIEVLVVNLEKARRRGALEAIKELSYDKRGNPNIKMHDSQDVLKHLDKMYQMTDDVEADPQAAARSHLETATEKMGLNVNILNVTL